MTKEEFEQKVKAAESIDRFIDLLKSQIEEAKEQLEGCIPERDAIYAELLAGAKQLGIKDEKINDLFVTYFCKEEIAWLDDVGLLQKLRENKANEYIKVITKTTVAIDKKALKKAFKDDEKLREEYKPFYGNKLNEYVTVTTEENHAKMLEHIEENKKEEKE